MHHNDGLILFTCLIITFEKKKKKKKKGSKVLVHWSRKGTLIFFFFFFRWEGTLKMHWFLKIIFGWITIIFFFFQICKSIKKYEIKIITWPLFIHIILRVFSVENIYLESISFTKVRIRQVISMQRGMPNLQIMLITIMNINKMDVKKWLSHRTRNKCGV